MIDLQQKRNKAEELIRGLIRKYPIKFPDGEIFDEEELHLEDILLAVGRGAGVGLKCRVDDYHIKTLLGLEWKDKKYAEYDLSLQFNNQSSELYDLLIEILT